MDETRAVAGWVLDQILVMLHPFMPFITEELWHAQGERPYDLIVAKWPEPEAAVDAAAKAEVDWLVELTGNIRTAKNELGIAPGAKLEAWLAAPSAARKGGNGGQCRCASSGWRGFRPINTARSARRRGDADWRAAATLSSSRSKA